MKVKTIPFNIELLDTSKQRLAGLLPVQSLSIYDATGEFHPMGLYSNQIFGEVGTPARNSRHGTIPLNTVMLHPKLFEELILINRLYKDILSGTGYAIWDNKVKDFIRSDILEGETGYAFFMSHFTDIVFTRNRSQVRGLRIDLIERYRNRATLQTLVVLPAGLREITKDSTGRDTEDEINKLYRKAMMTANGISETLRYKNNPLLDKPRWILQRTLQEIYKTLMTIIEGKRGFLQSKWASRKVAHGTRNVISAMDPSAESIDSPRAFDSRTTMAGLYQTLKGVEPLVVDWLMPQGIAKDLIDRIDESYPLIDVKTLKSVPVDISEPQRVAWATTDGRSALVTQLKDAGNRNKPIMIDGHYFKLIYQDKDSFKLLNSITDLPEDKDPSAVHPLTWTEFFYLLLYPRMETIRAFVTRYPVTSQDSIYPTVPYLKTTIDSHVVQQLNDDWVPEGLVYPEFPRPEPDIAFFDTVAVAISQLTPLGADYDGDTISMTFVWSEESVLEIDTLLNDKYNYLTAGGTLIQSVGHDIEALYLHNFTGDY